MHKWKDPLFSIAVLSAAVGLCFVLSGLFNDNNPWSVSIFILAVVLIARFTTGYWWGIFASGLSVVFVNWLFTYPFYEFNMSISGYPLTFTCMLIVSLLVSTLTTRIKKQDELRFAMEKEKLRSNLLRSVSHDIRTPLTSIMGTTTLLLENKSLQESEKKEMLGQINSDAHWLLRLTENILSATRFSDEDAVIRKESELMEEIISAAIVQFHRDHPNIKVRVHRPDEMFFVPMDATLIQQVLLNLFENSVIHGMTVTQIELYMSISNGYVWITVTDDGCGFDDSILPKAFDIYVKGASNETFGDRQSTGIGLSVCKAIIKAHGGNIEAENGKGGAIVRFCLPIGTQEE